MDRIDRIREMEARMERVSQWLDALSWDPEHSTSVQDDVHELAAYYGSDLWMEDYEADEAGELPSDLKRGVLSEDGLYDLLTEYENRILELRELGGG